jgi:ubiquinone/menaquinone biosynthesis C-methylase UbiE
MYDDGNDAPYLAKVAYRDITVAETYERVRYRSALGRYTHWREQRAVGELLERLPDAISMLDCPCGTGRWWPLLRAKASEITALDVSAEMLAYARDRPDLDKADVTFVRGDAESLPLDDDSVDYVFSHALMKHLPVPVQAQVLAEFARVARKGVLCSFPLLNHVTYEVWRRRDLTESFPLLPEQLASLASAAGLNIEAQERCTTPVGVEHCVLLAHAR